MKNKDHDLLRRYAEENDHKAFRALVQLYGPMVHGAALRKVGATDRANDISQEVFITLAKKAAYIGPKVSLAGWLFRVTRTHAIDYLRENSRRKKRETRYSMELTLAAEETFECWEKLSPLIDDTLQEIPEKDRDLVLMRYFSNRSNRFIAQSLNISEDAARKRISRAMDLLRVRLSKRGLTMTSATLLATIPAHAAPPLSTSLVNSLSTAAGSSLTSLSLLPEITIMSTKAKIIAATLVTGAFVHHFKLKDETNTKEQLLRALSVPQLNNDRVRVRSPKRGAKSSTSSHIEILLQLANGPLSAESFDPDHEMTWTEQHLALANHSEEEVRAFLEEIESPPFPKRSLSHLQSITSRLFPSTGDFGTQIEEALTKGGTSRSYPQLFQQWLTSDPDAAKKWLDDQLAENSLKGRGIDNDPLEILARTMAVDLFLKSPAHALRYYDGLSNTGKLTTRMIVAQRLAQGDVKNIGKFLEQVSDREMRQSVVDSFVKSQARAKATKDDILTQTNGLDLSHDERQKTLNSMLKAPELFKGEGLSSRIDWLQKSSGQTDLSPFLTSLVAGAYRDQPAELESWATTEANPQVKQELYQALTTTTLYQTRDLEKASQYLAQIQDPTIQQKIYQGFQIRSGEPDQRTFNEHLTAAGVDPNSLSK